jgi:hypothetical protein
MKLPEWQDMADLEETYKLRPYAAQWKIAAWIGRLDRALGCSYPPPPVPASRAVARQGKH